MFQNLTTTSYNFVFYLLFHQEIDPDRHSHASGGASPCGDGDSAIANSLQVF